MPKKRRIKKTFHGGVNKEIVDRIANAEKRIDVIENKNATENEYGLAKICRLSTVTEDNGLVLGAREKNPAVSGTLANKLANLNGAYRVRKTHTQEIVYSAASFTWQAISDFSYTVPQRSIVIMTVGFVLSQSATTNLEVFVNDSFFSTDVRDANSHVNFEKCVAFVAEKNQKIDVVAGVKPGVALTVYGSSDARIVRADYVVIPMK